MVDEVDGVVGGSGGAGEGGFVKALIDLINLDEKNSRMVGQHQSTTGTKRGKGDKFRLLRPLILICNDLYHPSLKPLRHHLRNCRSGLRQRRRNIARDRALPAIDQSAGQPACGAF
ncbi:MAG: hypothetical protein EOP89_15475 [Lysobacteraceae bacterium]|nr:MAG: hypothetical protein EOP89_15475 [Xanthomonadaceae bacterium]